MKNLIPLMQREWLQHRFAWALLMLVPFALAVMLLWPRLKTPVPPHLPAVVILGGISAGRYAWRADKADEGWWQTQIGFGYECLTESEAGYLFRVDAGTIRSRISEARQGLVAG